MALVLTVPEPDIEMDDGPWAVAFFRIGLYGCGELDGTETEQGVGVSDATLRGL